MTDSAAASDGFPAPLATEGRWTGIRPVSPADYGWLFDLFIDPSNLHSWNLRGRIPSYEEFPGILWDRVLVQFVIVALSTGAPIGLGSVYSADFRRRHAKLSLILDPDYRKLGWAMEGAGLVITYAFRNWDLRKVFAEMLEFNAAATGLSSGTGFVEEGRYRSFEFYDGRYWDLVIYGVERASWFERSLMNPAT